MRRTLTEHGPRTYYACKQECLVDEKDYNGKLSLETFEGLIAPLVARMSAPIEQALSEAGVTRQELEAVEIVGGSTR